MSLLELDDLTVRYGGLVALDEARLRVDRGSLVGLIGPNGAGKTTMIDCLTGFTPATSGHVIFDGHEVTSLPAHRRTRLGMIRTFQSLELFDDLSVRDNCRVAASDPRWWEPLADVVRPGRRPVDDALLDDTLATLGLTELAGLRPPELSHGHRKLVGIARVLVRKPDLLLLDEPAAGLDSGESQTLGRLLRGKVDNGASMLLIDHDMNLVLGICDRIYVLDFGRVIAEGTPDEIRNNPAVVAAYLGSDVDSDLEPTPESVSRSLPSIGAHTA
ncbi:ABC transporter ATP-binding protein [Aeromicrobium sp.]|uniref:ABC transporter ATP-binding protein n=1 Tax=Aeromicrobium sp. TaxID=1871063 RepID=UPI0019CD7C16|nr:ABC transporter ATP-binding protein [Aeromicrobium sp.]MBC7631326.1 ABC transporter ATP-binding protein [Aeromicrobium sp.]